MPGARWPFPRGLCRPAEKNLAKSVQNGAPVGAAPSLTHAAVVREHLEWRMPSGLRPRMLSVQTSTGLPRRGNGSEGSGVVRRAARTYTCFRRQQNEEQSVARPGAD
ncbi:hypothetical protein NDU88_001793 [Pleurodeles waltl]|uniref:Uncharacterized protein n=1 Tax=Pleurodeles waltl TaxID=8319 RepID=A0AAV7NC53_PLEWA|nr:hypothetical protein NDU88_001793 [Pleurodeles waltl]